MAGWYENKGITSRTELGIISLAKRKLSLNSCPSRVSAAA